MKLEIKRENISSKSIQGDIEGFFCSVVEAMLKTGSTENEKVKIGGGNYCRIFDKATSS